MFYVSLLVLFLRCLYPLLQASVLGQMIQVSVAIEFPSENTFGCCSVPLFISSHLGVIFGLMGLQDKVTNHH